MAVELGVAYVSVLPEARDFHKSLTDQVQGAGTKVSDSMSDEIDKSSKSGNLSKTFKKVATAAAGAFAIAGGGKLLKGFLDEAEEAEKVGRQTEAVLKSTGGAAGLTAKQIGDLASSLSKKAAVDDEVIQSGENVLLTFTNIKNVVGDGNDVFTQATGLALDMSSALGTDLQGSVIQVGKALNDPIKGITALSRVGVSFTEQQKDQIKALVESGDVMGAQKVILAELNKEFGGAAEASATTSQRMSVAWGNIQEQIGTALLPVLESFGRWFSDNGPMIGSVIIGIGKVLGTAISFIVDNKPILIGTLVAIGVGFTAWAVSAGAAAAATVVAAAPFIAIGAAIAAVVAALVYAYENWTWFRNAVDAVKNWIVDDLVPALKAAWEWIANAVTVAFNVVKAVVDAVFPYVAAIIQTYIDIYVTAFKVGVKVIQDVWATLEWLYHFIKDVVIDPILLYIKIWWEVFTTAVQVGVTTVITTWNTLVAIWNFLRDQIIAPISGAVVAFKDSVVGWFTETKDKVIAAWNGILVIVQWFEANIVQPVSSAVQRLRDAVSDAFQTAVANVSNAWNRLKEIAAVPIRWVVDNVYNKGIVTVWNLIPGLDDIKPLTLEFATGGWVPGVGSKDTVPIMATPGEFIVTKDKAKEWGPGVMELLNQGPGPTADPGIFGYAAGGYVRPPLEVLAFARQQAGKPYRYPEVGPNAYDCSGFMSALWNMVMGRNPYRRVFSTGSFGGSGYRQFGFVPGFDPSGFSVGVKLPYTQNRQGATVGHMAGTIAGVPAEAGSPVRVGGGARGANSTYFPLHFTLPGYGDGTVSGGDFAPPYVPPSPILVATDAAYKTGNFRGDLLNLMVAVAGGESGYNARVHTVDSDDDSYGLWQINDRAWDPSFFGIGSMADLFDPYKNAAAARRIYDVQGIRAWGAYTSGGYRRYTDQANAAVRDYFAAGGQLGGGFFGGGEGFDPYAQDRSIWAKAKELVGTVFPDMGEWGKHIFAAIKDQALNLAKGFLPEVMRNLPGIKQLLNIGQSLGEAVNSVFGSSEGNSWAAGAVVKATPGGVPGRVAEAGYDELITPLPPGFDIMDLVNVGLGEKNRIGMQVNEQHIHNDVDLDAVFRAANFAMAAAG